MGKKADKHITDSSTNLSLPNDGQFDTCSIGNYVHKNHILSVHTQANFCNYSSYVGDWDIEYPNSLCDKVKLTNPMNSGGAVTYNLERN